MATYLLRADDQDMARWKARAESRGRPFSQHLRDCLDLSERLNDLPVGSMLELTHLPVEAASAAERLGPDGAEAASTGGVSPVDTEGADRPPAPVQVASPVDLQERARELAAKLQERVK